MYTNRPWTIRQYAGFPPPKNQTRSPRTLPRDRWACRSHSILQPTVATTPITPGWLAMSARLVWRSTVSKT
ncbi:MAG: hypothetical protein R2706_19935 [Acidimicrobiales bacterium]